MDIFQVNLLGFLLHLFHNRTFLDKWHQVYVDRMPIQPLNQQCQSQSMKEETQSTDINHERSPTGFIVSSSTTRFLSEEALLPVCHVCDGSTVRIDSAHTPLYDRVDATCLPFLKIKEKFVIIWVQTCYTCSM